MKLNLDFELTKTDKLLRKFEEIHNFIYANDGLSTQQTLEEFIKILFIKVIDEKKKDKQFYIDEAEFEQIKTSRKSEQLLQRINSLFSSTIKEYSDLFDKGDRIKLSPLSLANTINKLQDFSLINSSNDAKGLAFQKFLSHQEKDGRGQFFTPEPIIDFCVSIIQPKPNETIIDPACGSGNFLIITYRELRLLEIDILRELFKKGEQVLDVSSILWLDVDQFYGIEYDEFASKIAEVAMWLIDHQMNMRVSEEFGQYFARLPLKKAAKIIHGNSLRINWEDVVAKTELSYIIGNPPFYGKSLQTKQQKEDMKLVFNKVKGAGVLDYVAAWYLRASQYIKGTKIKTGFVSTNSISQGEQTGILWNELLNNYNIKIHFAHTTFSWTNEAKGKAAVHCVIVGFANFDIKIKALFIYDDIKGEPYVKSVKNINPYLVEANDLVILKRRQPICNVSKISFGSMPNDGRNFLFTDGERKEFLQKEPNAERFIKPLLGGYEFLNGKNKWCLWLQDIKPNELKNLKEVHKRVENVKNLRLKSTRLATQKLAAFPTLFGEIRQPKNEYILIPLTSSENRRYIPMGFFSADFILNNTCASVDNASLLEFGILQSEIHMTWVKYTCGRLESRYRYSNEVVYNNYPWPKDPSEKNKKNVEVKAQKVLDVRLEFPESSLAELYHPLTMPPKLVKAHQALDKAVDLCYRPQAFTNETTRIEYLFDLYNQYTAPLLNEKKTKKKK